MALKIDFKKKNWVKDLQRTTRAFIFAFKRLITRPLKKNYAGYTVYRFPGTVCLGKAKSLGFL